jgi:uncharacterized protein (TIGR02265 family)
MDGFVTPDTTGPLDVAAALERCPPEATTRGMFLADIVEALQKKGLPVPATTYHAFGTYPQRDFITVAAAAAKALYPELGEREGLRRLGRLAYPIFADTMIGKVMFGVLGNDVGAVMRVSPGAYEAVLSHGRAELMDSGPRHARVRLSNVATFLDSYQVGVFEGTLLACKVPGTVKVRLESPVTGEFLVEW